VDIDLDCHADDTRVYAVPDLLSQALEKLMSNAVDFHLPGSAIRIELSIQQGMVDLAVLNQGPALAQDIDLFKSMVSGRTGRSEQPHLGLGLYLVRLIAEFHRGSAYADNLPDKEGVRIGLRFPGNCAGANAISGSITQVGQRQ
jgi:signal transduction histidine kinase